MRLPWKLFGWLGRTVDFLGLQGWPLLS
uniref:Microtubule-associated protein TORTIFOLIA1 isoform X2 n=1 Tax=Rhizophora mucronata TaxID=61149 RepID=A0A2P2QM70_RHIMU